MELVLKEKATFPCRNSHSFAQQQVLLCTQNKNIPQIICIINIMQNDRLKYITIFVTLTNYYGLWIIYFAGYYAKLPLKDLNLAWKYA